jgi:predicted Zn-dependent peptidase
MELIEKFRSEYYGADNFIYKFENGLRVIVTNKSESEEIYAAVLFKCGGVAEHQLNVPNGTIHFLEHMMINSPCELFPTTESKRLFRHGDSTKPSIAPNGTASPSYMWVYASSHVEGKDRVMKMLEGYLQPTKSDFETQIEKERQIIISEGGRRVKKELDSYFQFIKYMFKDIFPEMVRYTEGEVEDIQKISIDDLMKARTELMKGENAVIVIQTNRWPDAELQENIVRISEYFSTDKSNIEYKYNEFEDKFTVAHMHDPQMQNMLLDFNTLYRRTNSESDRIVVLHKFSRYFCSWSMYEHLRQKKELVYELDVFKEVYFSTYEDKGFQTKCSFKLLPTVLDAIEDLYESVWHELLYSEKGTSWLEGMKSEYIFKKTVNYDLDFPLDLAGDILLEDYFRPSFSRQIEIAKSLTKEELEEHFIQEYLTRPMKVWMRSSHQEDEVMEVFKASKLYKRLSKQQ